MSSEEGFDPEEISRDLETLRSAFDVYLNLCWTQARRSLEGGVTLRAQDGYKILKPFLEAVSKWSDEALEDLLKRSKAKFLTSVIAEEAFEHLQGLAKTVLESTTVSMSKRLKFTKRGQQVFINSLLFEEYHDEVMSSYEVIGSSEEFLSDLEIEDTDTDSDVEEEDFEEGERVDDDEADEDGKDALSENDDDDDSSPPLPRDSQGHEASRRNPHRSHRSRPHNHVQDEGTEKNEKKEKEKKDAGRDGQSKEGPGATTSRRAFGESSSSSKTHGGAVDVAQKSSSQSLGHLPSSAKRESGQKNSKKNSKNKNLLESETASSKALNLKTSASGDSGATASLPATRSSSKAPNNSPASALAPDPPKNPSKNYSSREEKKDEKKTGESSKTEIPEGPGASSEASAETGQSPSATFEVPMPDSKE